MFTVNTTTPVTCPVTLQWFWFAYSSERVTCNVKNQVINLIKNFLIQLRPVNIIFVGTRIKVNVSHKLKRTR
ncbi:hypothetical protein FHS57_001274 [Runella defluvii]|uniref:Uncharacterized protein n=1 Tax=Runella defluvii TaxID=370973 RepID=A0A7W5ZII4_9BACT|nr:hypothetical protein [Runella defluvii]